MPWMPGSHEQSQKIVDTRREDNPVARMDKVQVDHLIKSVALEGLRSSPKWDGGFNIFYA